MTTARCDEYSFAVVFTLGVYLLRFLYDWLYHGEPGRVMILQQCIKSYSSIYGLFLIGYWTVLVADLLAYWLFSGRYLYLVFWWRSP